MSYKIRVTDEARNDLRNLYDYIRKEFSEERALSVVQDVIKSYSALSIFPRKGKDADQLHEMLSGFYYLPLPRNTIFYKIEKVDEILILRIFSNRDEVIQKFLHFLNKQ